MARKPRRSALGQATPSLNVAQTLLLYSQNSTRGLRPKTAEPSRCQHFPVATVHQHQEFDFEAAVIAFQRNA